MKGRIVWGHFILAAKWHIRKHDFKLENLPHSLYELGVLAQNFFGGGERRMLILSLSALLEPGRLPSPGYYGTVVSSPRAHRIVCDKDDTRKNKW